ncbi:MAG TPA: SDR family oxidoreductase [Flavitalea sp.]|nr:SDR family oxidoreductase [Flavitalea sp.]
MNISLKGKTAIVCGSTQGIGLAIAKEFALSGANCILFARNEEKLKQVISNLDKSNDQHHDFKVVDFSDTALVKQVIMEIVNARSVEILVNNTGGPAPGPILESEESAFVDAFNQHLICNQILTQAVIPGMKKAGYGRIINIISTSVKIPLKNMGVSNTIRGAVASWAKTMSYELGAFNITVNNILPGFTMTQRLESLIGTNAKRRGVSEEVIRAEMINDIPMKRFGQASELAAVAAFLASPAASYVNGVSIPVDGGKTGSL